MAIGRVQLKKLQRGIDNRRRFASLVASSAVDARGIQVLGDSVDSEGSYWFLLVKLNASQLRCTTKDFAKALSLEGIDGVSAGYSSFPTDHAWHQSIRSSPNKFDLPNARSASGSLVRIDVHEFLGNTEAVDLGKALTKLAKYFSA
jgi:dTDP-4-amino-4,6-dideoxygalactose transaminase